MRSALSQHEKPHGAKLSDLQDICLNQDLALMLDPYMVSRILQLTEV